MKKKRKPALAWLGHRSYLRYAGNCVYGTRKEAKEAGWSHPVRVRLTLHTRIAGRKGD